MEQIWYAWRYLRGPQTDLEMRSDKRTDMEYRKYNMVEPDALKLYVYMHDLT
jgi:hypothetical protein